MHNLLKRQLKKTKAIVDEKFLALVNQAYIDADEDRELLEHSLDISSTEMQELYTELEIVSHKQLQESNDKYDALVYELRNHYFFYAHDKDMILTYLSNSVYNITGYTEEELINNNFLNYLTDDILNNDIRNRTNKIISGELREAHKISIYHKNGTILYIETSSYPVVDKNGKFIEIRGIARDITQEYQAQKQLYYLSNHDTLTGVSNRHNLYHKVEYIIADSKRNKKIFALMYIDLDNFKVINDTLGHEGGDILLQKLTKRVQGEIRENDLLARIGGDEFVIILTNVDTNYVSNIAKNILNSLSSNFHINNLDLSITVSIGIAIYPKDGDNIDKLLRNADNAMYKIKRDGKNNFSIYSST